MDQFWRKFEQLAAREMDLATRGRLFRRLCAEVEAYACKFEELTHEQLEQLMVSQLCNLSVAPPLESHELANCNDLDQPGSQPTPQ
jgi:hypothetical protein